MVLLDIYEGASIRDCKEEPVRDLRGMDGAKRLLRQMRLTIPCHLDTVAGLIRRNIIPRKEKYEVKVWTMVGTSDNSH
jgi:hypothetical protein